MRPEPPIPADLWDQVPPTAQTAVLALVQTYEIRLAALQQRIEDLEQRLGQNSTNSSRPPSADPPTVKRAPPRPPSGRRSGGQPGHALHQRPLLEPTQPPVILKPAACRQCGQALCGTDPQPLRHQVLELPAFRPEVTEYQLHRLPCAGCGRTTCATLPAGVPAGGQGPRLQAVVALLTGAYRLGKRQVESLCADLLGTPVSAGQVCAVEAETVAATAPVVAELRVYIKDQSANVDETGWWQKEHRAWLWSVVTRCVTVFVLALSRAATVVQDLLDPSAGQVITTDRYKGYDWWPLYQRQICWAHLRRDFQAMVDRAKGGAALGQELLLFAEDVFTQWYRVRDGTIRRSTLRSYVDSQRPWFRAQLEAGLGCGCAKTAAVCKDLLRLEPALWTFTRRDGVEPTNNAVERGFRHAAQWRRSSHGTESAAGSRFVEQILTVVATCRQQERHVLDYLTACCRAYQHGETPPSLLPS
ncbi:MAG TPA: IS66 family transposase [Gemmataceae bacterium]|nr:IS66 family transposase [Gemmataceae bacterium]